MLDELLPYYERELTSLRQLSKEFAAQYPKIAARLQLDGDTCADPHVERLIEGFAFLTARIHHKLDDEFPEITDAMLDLLYPHYLKPIPSMAITQFHIDPTETQFTGRYSIPRHTSLFSRPVNGLPCTFRTCYPVHLWPISVTEARFEPLARSAFSYRPHDAVAVIRIRLSCLGENSFETLGMDKLRFFLQGESPLMHALYELLHNNTQQTVLATGPLPSDQKTTLPPGSIQPVGFTKDEAVLEQDNRSFLGYRLLHEYFTFPEKFLFFDLGNLAGRLNGFTKDLEIAIFLSPFQREDRLARLAQTVTADTFRLGCTPIVNLFEQLADPIRLTHQKTEYQVMPDVRRPWALEVYSINSVRKLSKSQDKEELVEFQPFFSFRHAYQQQAQRTFWHSMRRASPKGNDPGTEVYLSLVDLNFNPALPNVETLSISTTCTNRDLPGRLPFGGEEGDFSVEGSSLISRIRCLTKPTPTLRPPLGRSAQWRLISHLSLNHLSLTAGGRDALLEILSLYNFSGSSVIHKQISGITQVTSNPITARMGTPQRASFVRGTQVHLEFDEDQYIGSGVYLLATVLEHFFALYSAANSFTQLVVTTQQREKALATWPPRAGEAILA